MRVRVGRAGDLAVRPRADELVDLACLAADARELLALVVLIAHLGRGRGRRRRRRRRRGRGRGRVRVRLSARRRAHRTGRAGPTYPAPGL